MAEIEQLRAAMLAQLVDTEFLHGLDLVNEAFRAQAVDALLPLIESWTQNLMLVSAEDYAAITAELEREEPRDDLDRLAALFTTPTVFDKEEQ